MKNRFAYFLLAFFAGALHTLAFAPFGLWPLSFLSLALLYVLCVPVKPAQAMALAFVWGMGHFGTGVSWVYISLHDYGGMAVWLSALAAALFAAVMAIFPALALGLLALSLIGDVPLFKKVVAQISRASGKNTTCGQNQSKISARGQKGTCANFFLIDFFLVALLFASAYTFTEWLRGWVFTGFAWLLTGYAHTASPLAGFAPVLGVLGVGFLSCIIAALLAQIWRVWRLRTPVSHRQIGILLSVCVGILALGAGLRQVEFTSARGAPISVRLLQGNIPQSMKFDPAQAGHTLGQYQAQIQQAPADLIVLPETALVTLPENIDPNWWRDLNQFSRNNKSTILVGAPLKVAEGYANGAIAIGEPSTSNWQYIKRHLVPFGEFVPWGFKWFVDLLQMPLGDFARGKNEQTPLHVGTQKIALNICYEDVFGEELLGDAARANILLNISNLAWFGDSLALPQHLQIAQMRALETGRPVLTTHNTGITAAIDAHGHVLAQLPAHAVGALALSIQGTGGDTPYVIGGRLNLLALIGLLLLLLYIGKKSQSASHSQAN